MTFPCFLDVLHNISERFCRKTYFKGGVENFEKIFSCLDYEWSVQKKDFKTNISSANAMLLEGGCKENPFRILHPSEKDGERDS